MSARNWLIFAGMIAVLFAMIVVYGIKYDPQSVATPKSEPEVVSGDTVRVTAQALVAAYEKDEKRSNRAFKNRLCEVMGLVKGVTVNWLGEPVVELVGDRSGKKAISFTFLKRETERVQILNKGDRVAILGVCVGKEPRYGVRFKQCVLVEKLERSGGWEMREN